MLQNRLGLTAAMVSLIFLGCTNQETPNSLAPSPNSSQSTTTITTTNTSKTVTPSPDANPQKPVAASSKASTKAIGIGDIKELEGDIICGKTRVIYAYGETSNYRVYICADSKEPNRPRYYISRNKDGSGGLDLEATNYNPQKDGAIEFNNEGYIYTLESPTTQNPEPVLRVTFPNQKLTEEKLLRYLTRSNKSNSSATNPPSDPLQYVLQNRESLGVCKDNFRAEDGKNGMGSKAFKISDKKYLVQIQCFLAAYQGNFEYVLWIDESPTPRAIPLEFDSFQEPKEGEKPKRITDRSIAGLPRFNVRSQTLTNFTKFRGVGDCGSSALYKLEGDRMVLQEYRAKYACDGNYVQDFPIIYP
ncbi:MULTISPECIES: DUF1176 domain-containing protein [Pseudanabaena]|uniref:DUF1176 domain-containing protein n=1 Tax=Pseudanabaena TaxID=1152 RepID=UPI00247917C4|nr:MULTISPECIES: DUF1176 domain-containing protein [Pseudanabaena]MEA5489379.1 DUF1176 domain-containing protein [Pseudanabaena sp. CCNP1317]WGS72789.1 DUF1176 domain-containing protein [Pseudanabaena galeata CCNP1313]